MFSLLYNTFLLCLFLPKLFLKKYRSNLLERLTLKGLDFAVPKNKNVVLIHAVSLGETKAAASLVQKLKKDKNTFVVFTSITQTGHLQSKKMGADLCLFLPLDFSFVVKRFFAKVKPKTVLLIEGDIWYHFLKFAKKQHAQIFLVSGKISEKSTSRFCLFPGG